MPGVKIIFSFFFFSFLGQLTDMLLRHITCRTCFFIKYFLFRTKPLKGFCHQKSGMIKCSPLDGTRSLIFSTLVFGCLQFLGEICASLVAKSLQYSAANYKLFTVQLVPFTLHSKIAQNPNIAQQN